ncbi:MAG: hypothetical protein IJT24_04825 [Lachnospiraceae bacterium]|nr:hypothetical protein [Lachnospiraceae bacterium]
MTLNEKANDLRSSGYALSICGGLGIIAMILVFAGVIPVSLGGAFGIVTKCVMTLLFILFFAAGIQSFRRSKEVALEAQRETEKKKEIKKWFSESFDAKSIDEIVDSGLEENDLYFERIDYIKDKICERFMDVEDALMSEITEELYSELFEDNRKS